MRTLGILALGTALAVGGDAPKENPKPRQGIGKIAAQAKKEVTEVLLAVKLPVLGAKEIEYRDEGKGIMIEVSIPADTFEGKTPQQATLHALLNDALGDGWKILYVEGREITPKGPERMKPPPFNAEGHRGLAMVIDLKKNTDYRLQYYLGALTKKSDPALARKLIEEPDGRGFDPFTVIMTARKPWFDPERKKSFSK